MSTKTIVILVLAIVIEIILVHFLVSIRKVDGDAQTQVESLQEDIEKYKLQIDELKKQSEVKQIQIEKKVKKETQSMTSDEISRGIIEELSVKEDANVEN